MKDTGIVRKIDELGRVVLPIELRRIFDLNERDAVRIYTDEKSIILMKEKPSCLCCSSTKNLMPLSANKFICRECYEKIPAQDAPVEDAPTN